MNTFIDKMDFKIYLFSCNIFNDRLKFHAYWSTYFANTGCPKVWPNARMTHINIDETKFADLRSYSLWPDEPRLACTWDRYGGNVLPMKLDLLEDTRT